MVDARGAWATPERFSSADEIHVMHADDYLKGHPLTGQSYVAVLSHDPKLDDPALLGALQSDARFVGAIVLGMLLVGSIVITLTWLLPDVREALRRE